MILPAVLLYLAETALSGPWQWSALFVGVLLAIRSSSKNASGDRADFQLGRGFAGLTVLICAIAAPSPSLGIAALGLLWNRRSLHFWAALVLVALGVHVVCWRYLATFGGLHLPSLLGSTLSALLPRALFLADKDAFLHGIQVSYSAVPLETTGIPFVLAATILHTGRDLARALGRLLIVLAATAAVMGTMALSGHSHFFSEPWWPILCAVGATSAVPGKWPDRVPSLAWGRWSLITVSLMAIAYPTTRPDERSLRILFDEGHGQWEPTTVGYNTADFGRTTTYNYSLLSRWLGTKHTVEVSNHDLADIAADVVVIKMPTSYYSRVEKNALDRFLRRGGLLLVIGDHTNLFGTGFVINDLLGPYGIEIEFDATAPWDGEHYDLTPRWWQRTPYLRGISTLQFQTAATIRAHDPRVSPVLVADRVSGEDADYSNERFFGDLHPGLEDRFPPLVVASERSVGSGRILIFGDSTIFSSFSLATAGNLELFQNMIEFGHASSFTMAGATLAIGLPILGFWLLRHESAPLLVGSLVPVTVMVATLASGSHAPKALPAPWISIDRTHSHVELRADPRGTHGPTLDDYSTFVGWIGRTGAIGHEIDRPYVSPHAPTIILNPDVPFSPDTVDQIEQYVRRGGHLLVLDDAFFRGRSTSSQLLDRFDIELKPVLGAGGLFDAGATWFSTDILGLPLDLLRSDRVKPGRPRVAEVGVSLVVSGADPVLVDADGRAVLAQRSVGQGLVLAMSRSTVFSDFAMGDVWGGTEVAPDVRQLYRLEFDVLRRLREGAPQ